IYGLCQIVCSIFFSMIELNLMQTPLSSLVLPKETDAISFAKEKNIDDIPSSSTKNPIAEPPAFLSKKRWLSSFFKRKGKGLARCASQENSL
uniref:Uncharacterized protein n=1 Tax=Aegilops tauschii subsp. strangulata TaxID=200361 RepID=A0A453T3W3_AEGTS